MENNREYSDKAKYPPLTSEEVKECAEWITSGNLDKIYGHAATILPRLLAEVAELRIKKKLLCDLAGSHLMEMDRLNRIVDEVECGIVNETEGIIHFDFGVHKSSELFRELKKRGSK